MAEIYRKAALDKLSSPEQLDKMIKIISPSFWIAAIGGGGIILVATIWSIFGRLPENVSTNGIYMGESGIHTVTSEIGGVVTEILVEEGDTVKKGQEIARIDTSKAKEEISNLERRKQEIQKVTFDSENDVATSDTKSLIDIKAQKMTGGSSLNTNKELLAAKQKELDNQKSATANAKATFEQAQAIYLSTMSPNDSSAAQAAYQMATTKLNSAQQSLDSYRAQLAQSGASIEPLQEQYGSVENSRNSAESNRSKAQNKADQALNYINKVEAFDPTTTTDEEKNVMVSILNEIGITVPVTTDDPPKPDFSDWSNIKTTANDILANTYNEQSQLAAQYEAEVKNYNSNLSSIKSNVDTAKNTQNAYSGIVGEWYGRVSDAQSAYNSAESAYISTMQAAANQQAQNSQAGVTYNVALSTYQTELSQKRNLEDAVIQLTAQVAADEENLAIQNAALKMQFDSAKDGTLDQIEQEIRKYEKQIQDGTIKSTHDGYISGLNITEGNSLSQGASVCRIASPEDEHIVVCYVSVADGKKITPGMQVVIYPSTVNKQEYGHMEGTVTTVDEYVTSQEEIQNQLGDPSLTQAFTKDGPVVSVKVRLRRDATTVSGFWWSSKKGKTVSMTEGTMVSTDTIIQEKAPITMLIPLLKEKLSVKRDM